MPHKPLELSRVYTLSSLELRSGPDKAIATAFGQAENAARGVKGKGIHRAALLPIEVYNGAQIVDRPDDRSAQDLKLVECRCSPRYYVTGKVAVKIKAGTLQESLEVRVEGEIVLQHETKVLICVGCREGDWIVALHDRY